MRLLTAQDFDVYPDYRMFGIGEAAAGFGESPPVPGAGWLGVGQASVMIGVMNDLPGTRPLRLEHWDGEPPVPDGHDVVHTVFLQLPTGKITIDQITAGGQETNLDLRPGLYAARIFGWRQEPADERYLVQFWLLWPTAGLVRSAGCQINDGYDRFGIVDAAAGIHEVPPVGADWLAADSALVQIRHGSGRPVLRLELWDGPPPGLGPAQLRKPIRLQLPSGRMQVLQLRAGVAGVKEIRGGMLPLTEIPPGDYRVDLSTHEPGNYLFRCWLTSP
ncbi:hypothetical protein JOF56_000731 [Kibdelosporangium banguiense]|uniref:Uncharacterized protein n=1 Tax=Kibdelosporangium banguiense TaxID=1365924 RepID=A0ABS4T7R1_9PSEU|nr:hypothetical protein [Kibdelosporangium banguiense]MBP2320346.1 hypothetical protein [Kibdelosporangium banguiense]